MRFGVIKTLVENKLVESFKKDSLKTDMDLHKVTENVIELAKEDRVLDMDDYNTIINPDESINELVKAVMTKLKSK